jgi:lipoprotein-releasing system permease protein
MAFGAFERLMATRYLRARRQEGFISVNAWFSIISIGLGVAALIIVMSVMNGFRAELAARIQGINAHVVIEPDPPGTIADPAPAVTALRGVEGVANASPVVDRQVMGAANGVAVGARVLGLPPDGLRARPLIAGNITRGSLDAFQGDDAIVIGYRIAERLGLDIGAQINLIAPQAPQGNLLVSPRTRSYQVVAIFQTGMFEVDNTNAFLPLDAAAAFFNVDGATGIELMLADPDRVNALRAALQAAAPGLKVTDWQQRNATLFNALLVEKNVMFVILTLVVLVAAFNIVATLIMLVAEKGRGIAILRTMGAAQGAISRVFFMIGAAIGVLGTLGGLVIGVGFTANIERIRGFLQSLFTGDEVPAEVAFLLRLPARMDEREIVVVAVIALVLAVIAAIYPSWRASRLDPVEALRYE